MPCIISGCGGTMIEIGHSKGFPVYICIGCLYVWQAHEVVTDYAPIPGIGYAQDWSVDEDSVVF
jgi:hypothetical protein